MLDDSTQVYNCAASLGGSGVQMEVNKQMNSQMGHPDIMKIASKCGQCRLERGRTIEQHVLVSWGHHNTWYHQLGGLKDQTFVLLHSGGRMSHVEAPAAPCRL